MAALADGNVEQDPVMLRGNTTTPAVQGRELENYLLGGRIQAQHSPGNYTLQETAYGLEYIGYDAQGAPNVFGTIMRKPAP